MSILGRCLLVWCGLWLGSSGVPLAFGQQNGVSSTPDSPGECGYTDVPWAVTPTGYACYWWPAEGQCGQYTINIKHDPVGGVDFFSASYLADIVGCVDEYTGTPTSFVPKLLLGNQNVGTIRIQTVSAQNYWDAYVNNPERISCRGLCMTKVEEVADSHGRIPPGSTIKVWIDNATDWESGWTEAGKEWVVQHEICHALGMVHDSDGIMVGDYSAAQPFNYWDQLKLASVYCDQRIFCCENRGPSEELQDGGDYDAFLRGVLRSTSDARAFLRSEVHGLQGGEKSGSPAIECVVYAPQVFCGDLLEFYKGFWESRHGIGVEVVDTGTFTGTSDEVRAAIQLDIANWYSNGVNKFHLVGDASDWEYAPPGRGADPARDLIPTFLVREWFFDLNTQDWWGTDFPYSDLDSDGMPDVVVTRWPVFYIGELLNRIIKMVEYNKNRGAGSDLSGHTILSLVNDLDVDGQTHLVGPGEQALSALGGLGAIAGATVTTRTKSSLLNPQDDLELKAAWLANSCPYQIFHPDRLPQGDSGLCSSGHGSSCVMPWFEVSIDLETDPFRA